MVIIFKVTINGLAKKGLINFNLTAKANIENISFNNTKFNNNTFSDTLGDGVLFILGDLKSKDIDFSLLNGQFNNNDITNSLIMINSALEGKQYNINNNEFKNNNYTLKYRSNGTLNLNNANVSLNDNIFEGNSNDFVNGSPALNLTGKTNAIIKNNIFENNHSIGDDYSFPSGGGIYMSGNAESTIDNSKFIGNKAYDGGGLFLFANAKALVTNSEFNQNSATDDGGGISMLQSGKNVPTLSVDNTSFIKNTAVRFGGGISHVAGELNIKTADFEGNIAGQTGGGLYNHEKTTTTLWNVFMDQNHSEEYGGSLYVCPNGTIDIRLNNSLALFNDNAVKDGDSIYTVKSENNVERTVLKVAKYSLGLGKTLIYNDLHDNRYKAGDEPLDTYQYINTTEYLKFNMSDYDIAKDRADIKFIGNVAGSHGGGIGSNGNTIFGDYGDINIDVEKTWDDNNNATNKRPDDINVVLKGNGVVMDEAKLTKDNDYKYAFTELPKGYDKYQIDYTIEESDVPNYETSKLDREEVKDANGEVTGYKFVIENKLKEEQPREVTPEKPTLDTNVKCEEDYKLELADTEGVEYTITWDGKIATVVATAKEGYVINDDVTSEWTLDVSNPEKCPVTPPTTGPEKPEPGKPETTNPTKPLPGTGSNILSIVVLLTSVSILGITGLVYRKN